jgi:hypothetical protein
MRVDEHEGAVEADKPAESGQGNENAQHMDDETTPTAKDKDKIAADRIGANMDETQG